MIRCVILLLGVSNALGGVSIQMPYLHPAGVTYSGLSGAVPAIPSHFQYNAAATSSVAYGNGAFLGRAYTPGALSYAAAPVAHVAAPVVPAIHHLPAVAQVPVAKYLAQPAVIRNLVDVAKPKLASRKIEIRRPAIQKEFYDVEERVIIRPAGSAVVELDTPVSKSQKGPTVVQPAVHAVHSTPVVGFRTIHGHHHIYPSSSYPASVSVHPYPIQGPSASIPDSPTPIPPQEIDAQPEEIPQQQPEQFQEQAPEQQPEQFQEQVSQQDTAQFPQQIPQEETQQFDDSDSVSVDNPEIARARQQQPQSSQELPQVQNLFRSFQQQPNQLQQIQQQQERLFDQFQSMSQLRAAERQQSITRSQVQAQEQVVAQLQAQAQAQQAQLQRSEQLLQVHQQVLDRSRQAAESVDRSQSTPQAQPQPSQSLSRAQTEQQEGLPSVGLETVRSSERFNGGLDAANIRSAFIGNLARSTSSPSVIPSVRISPEQSLTNQERLISLLTARGGVVEARNQGDSSNSQQVRARVLSVTPAPEGASPREEKVNTRRIVFSRPIQTVEEVDVVEPFTKIERVAVHSPAVIKSAHLGVAHVPTSVPVQGYTHALHAAIPAYY